MPAKRSLGTKQSLTFIGALLLTSAFTVPALAQIETVVVTAQKRAEDVQSVPISITAYTAQDLAAHQVKQFKDIVFSTPNVSYTKGNFTGSNFQIRGIGVTAIGYDAESGVAVHLDDIFLSEPPLAEANFYDLDRVEVLRGPQSTLYGRGATGGSVNIITAKADLSEFGAQAEASYGNYNATEVKAMVNMPIISDELAVRVAGDWNRRDGFVTNLFNGDKLDDRDQYSFRGSVRWQPREGTTIDIIAQISKEDDNRMRAQKQFCTTDPTGTLGCLPDSRTNGLVNLNATLATIASSVQGINSAFAGGGLAGIGYNLGLFNLDFAPQIPAVCLQAGNPCNPDDPRSVYTDFNPTYHAKDHFVALNMKQRLSDWLDATIDVGYDDNAVLSQESYNNVAGAPFQQTPGNGVQGLGFSEAYLLGLLTTFGGSGYADHYAPFFNTVPGALPTSGIENLGLIGGNIENFSDHASAYDQSNGQSKQWSGELRFNSNFEGPVNFLLAGYYLSTQTSGDYFVNSNTLDYPSIVLGSISGLFSAPSLCFATGCMLGPSFYHNVGDKNTLTSRAVFGEVYWDIIPEELKLTGGLRWTEDRKFQRGRIELYSGLVPLGTTDEKAAMADLVAQGQIDFDESTATPDVWQINRKTFDKLTGRLVADWTPRINDEDTTHIYASYSRGYKAGGFNPGIQAGLNVPSFYKPESIDAYEIGAKNTLFGNTLQANFDVWYYDYKDLQVSAIENNTSVNQNINAKLWGAEGELNWAPSEGWLFNASLGTTQSSIQNSELVDDRNPTGGRPDVVLIKDATLGSNVGQNCVFYLVNGQTLSPADNPAFQAAVPGLFFAPPGGSGALASHGVALTNYGSCAAFPESLLNLFGYSRVDPLGHGTASGAFVNLDGNELQNTPKYTISVGGQYTWDMDGGYSLVFRADYYWQDKMWGRIFNGPSDAIESWDVTNALITLNSPDKMWYVQGFIQNIFDNTNETGMYLTSSTSGLYTNSFFGDPRTYGIRIGARF
jgi:outer membrane receptor protein involved in Fe transport